MYIHKIKSGKLFFEKKYEGEEMLKYKMLYILIMLCISSIMFNCSNRHIPFAPYNNYPTKTVQGTITLAGIPVSNSIVLASPRRLWPLGSTYLRNPLDLSLSYTFNTKTDSLGNYTLMIPEYYNKINICAGINYNSDNYFNEGDISLPSSLSYNVSSATNIIDISIRYIYGFSFTVIYANALDPKTYIIKTKFIKLGSYGAFSRKATSSYTYNNSFYQCTYTGYCTSEAASMDLRVMAYQDLNTNNNLDPGEVSGTNQAVTVNWTKGDKNSSTFNFDTVVIQYTN